MNTLPLHILILIFILLFDSTMIVSMQAKENEKRPKVALVLSGGGFRGMAQIGVLKVLERYSIPIDYVIGTSIGAYIGGLYATGYTPDEIEQIVLSTDWEKLLSSASEVNRQDMFLDQKIADDRHLFSMRLNTFSFDLPKAVSKGIHYQGQLQELLWNAPFTAWQSFDSLRIPFRAISTDLITGTSIIHRSGDLPTIIKASSTIPLRYSPVRYDSLLLVDGGVLDNVPVNVAKKEFNPDIIITVNSISGLLPEQELNTPWSIAEQIVGIMLKSQEEKSLLISPITISPVLDDAKNTDPTHIPFTIVKGEIAALQAISIIKDSLRAFGFYDADSSLLEHKEFNHVLSIDSTVISRSMIGMIDSIIQLNTTLSQKKHDIHRLLRRDSISFVRFNPIMDTISKVITWKCSPPKEFKVHVNHVLDSSRVISELMQNSLLNTILINNQWDALISGDEYEQIDIRPKFIHDTLHYHIQTWQKSPQYIGVGARVDNERYGQLVLDGYDANVLGTSLWSSLSLIGGSRNRSGQLSVGKKTLFGSQWGFTFHGYSSYKQMFQYQRSIRPSGETYDIKRLEELREDRFGIMADITRTLGKSGILQSRFRLEQQRIYEIQSNLFPTNSPILTWKIQSKIDTRDDADLPKSGRFLELSLETSLPLLQNQISFSRINASFARSITFNKFTITPRLNCVFSDNSTPNPEFVSLGRDDMFFGKREDDQRGAQLILGSCEFRWASPISFLVPLHFSARYDFGSTWNGFETISIGSMQHGIGFTMHAKTPLGPARISAGKSFFFVSSPDGVIQGPLLFSFSIGTRF